MGYYFFKLWLLAHHSSHLQVNIVLEIIYVTIDSLGYIYYGVTNEDKYILWIRESEVLIALKNRKALRLDGIPFWVLRHRWWRDDLIVIWPLNFDLIVYAMFLAGLDQLTFIAWLNLVVYKKKMEIYIAFVRIHASQDWLWSLLIEETNGKVERWKIHACFFSIVFYLFIKL